MKIVKHSISPQLRHVKNNFTIFVNFLIFNVICWCDFWKTGSKSCKLEVTFAIHLSDADVHEWSVFPFPHRADLSHHACCRASLSGESCWFSSCYSVSAIYLHYDSVRWKVIIEISIRKFKKMWNLLTKVRDASMIYIKLILQTVEAEITAMMPLQRACGAESQVRNKLSNGPLRAQSNETFSKYSATLQASV